MKTLEDALSALEALENGTELVEAVKGHTSKINNEAKNLRDRLKAAEATAGTVKKFYDLHGLTDEIDDIDSAIEQIKNKQSQSGNQSAQQLKALEARLKTLEQERDKAINDSRKERAGSELTKLLTENEVRRDVFGGLKDVLMLRVQFDEDGKPVYKDDDGVNIPVNDGVKKYLSANPGFLTNNQNPGGGGNGGRGDGKTMTRSDFDAMPSSKARAAFVTDGGTVVDD